MAPEYKDYYKILGVEKTSTTEVIAKAYKKLARKYHPDLNPNNPEAEDKFKEVTEAYEVLKDDEKRKLYDQLGPNWQNSQQFQGGGGGFNFNGQNFESGDFSDFFETLFGNMGNSRTTRSGFGANPFGSSYTRQQRGRDVEAEISISLEDSVKGGEKSFTLDSQQGQRNLKVNIPAGIKEGAKLRLAGQGGSGQNSSDGDLFLKIKFMPHPIFIQDGTDLIYDLHLMPWEAVLGSKARIPTLEGDVELNIPKATSSGRKMRLSNKGLGLGAGKGRGNLLVRIQIDAPSDLSPKALELWEALSAEAEEQTNE